MEFIDKRKTQNRLEGLRINRLMLEPCWDGANYVNLRYENVDKTAFIRHLVDEQRGFCCYCMRRLYLQNEGNHTKNVTLEHVIPNNIKREEWDNDKEKYRKFSLLNDRNVIVCYEGKVPDDCIRFDMPPFPHFLSYDNIVASCDGKTLDENTIIPHHCCNNMRGNIYIEPLYFHSHVSDEISYNRRGHLICEEEYVSYLDKSGVNIMSSSFNRIRRFWYKISDSAYNVNDIQAAEDNEEIRINIIDDVFTSDSKGQWLFLMEKEVWCIYSEYDWFYEYYSHKY